MNIDSLFLDYTGLQEDYRKWALQFETNGQLCIWLDDQEIEYPTKAQNSFNLFSAHWNNITWKVLKKEVPSRLETMKKNLTSFADKYQGDRLRFLYLLYFIHPVRHELYYYNEHYHTKKYQGYNSRLAFYLRSHRQGLKGLIKRSPLQSFYQEPYVKACSTTIFRHLRLHPSTLRWQSPRDCDWKEKLSMVTIDKSYLLSEQEKCLALSLGRPKSSDIDLRTWLSYAPCAINEGPMFILKQGNAHEDCFDHICRQLSLPEEPTQEKMQAILSKFYEITEYKNQCA
jgi:hypothetical protein